MAGGAFKGMGMDRKQAVLLLDLALPVLTGSVRFATCPLGFIQTLPDGSVLITPLPVPANDTFQPPEPPRSAA